MWTVASAAPAVLEKYWRSGSQLLGAYGMPFEMTIACRTPDCK